MSTPQDKKHWILEELEALRDSDSPNADLLRHLLKENGRKQGLDDHLLYKAESAEYEQAHPDTEKHSASPMADNRTATFLPQEIQENSTPKEHNELPDWLKEESRPLPKPQWKKVREDTQTPPRTQAPSPGQIFYPEPEQGDKGPDSKTWTEVVKELESRRSDNEHSR